MSRDDHRDPDRDQHGPDRRPPGTPDAGPGVRRMDPGARVRARDALMAEVRRPDATHSRGRWVLAAAAAAAVALVVVPSLGDRGAYASWTAAPAGLAVDDAAAAGRLCRDFWTSALGVGDGGPAAEGTPPAEVWAEMRTVVAERRGGYTFTVIGTDAWVADCLFHPRSLPDRLLGADRPPTGSGALTPRAPDTQPPADGAVLDSLSAGGGEEGTYSMLTGRVGNEVVRVEVTPEGGEKVLATVAGGAFVAWWPGPMVEDVVVDLRLADGSVVEGLSVHDLRPGRPPLP